jgi:hypothetical protein
VVENKIGSPEAMGRLKKGAKLGRSGKGGA